MQTGLSYFGYRFYYPLVGRWALRDPIGFVGGDVNLYGFVGSNPVNLGDLEGTIGIIGAIGIISGAWAIGGWIGEVIIWWPIYSDLSREIDRARKQIGERTPDWTLETYTKMN